MDPLEKSARFIDEGIYEGSEAVNPITGELRELADRVSMVELFSHVVTVDTGDGLVVFDTSLEPFGPIAVKAIRTWRYGPVHTIVYTHGHLDHVGGTRAFEADADERGYRRPTIVSHENVVPRFNRYVLTAGYNEKVNKRQFRRAGLDFGGEAYPGPLEHPLVTYRDRLEIEVGELKIELHHDRGETDDHTWAYIPSLNTVVSGDFLCWVFPNAGNPQKVQRYPHLWARALRKMAALEPDYLLPAHGLPIAGKERIGTVLGDVATALESLVQQTLDLMNDGESLNDIVHAVSLPEELLEKPYLQPTYDEPEFVVRNIWRLYGGWYDQYPARLKPPDDRRIGNEVAALSGGAGALVERARELAGRDDFRTACQLVDWAFAAEPRNLEVLTARAEIYRERAGLETSLMAKGIFFDAAQIAEDAQTSQVSASAD